MTTRCDCCHDQPTRAELAHEPPVRPLWPDGRVVGHVKGWGCVECLGAEHVVVEP